VRQKKELGMVLIFLGLFFGYALLEVSQRGLQATFQNPVSWSGKSFESDPLDRLVRHFQCGDGSGDHHWWN
jgi:hypothetical protein